MPANFFSFAWPLIFTLIVLAGLIVSIAALATLVAALARARQVFQEKERQANTGADEGMPTDSFYRTAATRTGLWPGAESNAIETVTRDGIHYNPVP
jgi:hypothetical protein